MTRSATTTGVLEVTATTTGVLEVTATTTGVLEVTATTTGVLEVTATTTGVLEVTATTTGVLAPGPDGPRREHWTLAEGSHADDVVRWRHRHRLPFPGRSSYPVRRTVRLVLPSPSAAPS